jgi:hypothetical protein
MSGICSRHSQTRHTFGIILAGIGLAAAISISAAQTIFQPRPLKQFLEENGWVSLPIPDKKMGPGSVIKVTKKDGAVSVQWLGDLRRCGITDEEFGFVRGKYPAIGIGQSFAVRASIAAGFIAKLDGTADFEKAGGAILQIEGSGGDAVDLGALTIWMARPSAAQRMPQVCNNFLAQEDIYLVTEAFRVSKASYGLVDKNGAKLAVTGGAFGRAGSGSSGTLSVVDDLYFGVRRVKQLAPVLFEPSLGARTVPEADSLLRLMEP